MADPKDLQEAADAIHEVRGLAAVQRHKELDEPLRQAEEWARKEYRKVREENGIGTPRASNAPHITRGACFWIWVLRKVTSRCCSAGGAMRTCRFSVESPTNPGDGGHESTNFRSGAPVPDFRLEEPARRGDLQGDQ
jgi:hypothetical protein